MMGSIHTHTGRSPRQIAPRISGSRDVSVLNVPGWNSTLFSISRFLSLSLSAFFETLQKDYLGGFGPFSKLFRISACVSICVCVCVDVQECLVRQKGLVHWDIMIAHALNDRLLTAKWPQWWTNLYIPGFTFKTFPLADYPIEKTLQQVNLGSSHRQLCKYVWTSLSKSWKHTSQTVNATTSSSAFQMQTLKSAFKNLDMLFS